MKLFQQYRGLRRELYILCLCQLIDSAGSLVGPMFTMILSEKMGMSAGEIAAYFLLYTVLSLPIQLLGGKLVDIANKKLLINIGDIVTSSIYILCGVIGLNRVTLIVYLVGSLLQEIEIPAYESLIADFTASDDRERAYSLSYLGMNLGLILAPTLGGLLMKEHLGLMFILSGVFEFISLFLFDIFITDIHAIRDTSNQYEKDVSGKSTLRVLLESRILIPFLTVYAFSILFYHMYSYLMPLSLSELHGDAGSLFYGTVSSLNCVTVLVFTALLTTLFARFTSLDKMIFGNLFELAGLGLFYFGLGYPVLYYIAIVLFTIGEILNTITTTPHLTKRIPINFRGRIMAATSILVSIIMSVGEYGIGKIYDHVSPDAAWLAVLLIGALTIIGYWLMKKPDRKIYPDLYDRK